MHYSGIFARIRQDKGGPLNDDHAQGMQIKSMQIPLDGVPSRSENVVFRKIENEYILVPLLSTSADVEAIYNLNEIGAIIWEHIDGKKSLREIIGELAEEYEVEPEEAERDVLDFVRDLTGSQLIRMS